MTAPRGNRRKLPREQSGRRLWATGVWLGLSTGATISTLPFLIAEILRQGSASWYLVALALLTPASLVSAVTVDRGIGKHVTSRLLAGLTPEKPTGEREYVLYLRSFGVDDILFETERAGGANFGTSLASNVGFRDPAHLGDTWEGRLVLLFRRFGRVLRVGRPGEPFPLPGARRFYLPDSGQDWRVEVSAAIRSARLVVIVAAIGEDTGSAEGTLWEYTEAVRLLPPHAVVLAVCGERADYERFRDRAVRYFAEREAELRLAGEASPPPPPLPDWPDAQRPWIPQSGYPLRGVVHFDADWNAEFAHFDSTAERGLTQYARWRKTVRRQVDPWMDGCEQRLAGRAVRPVTLRWHWHMVVLAALALGLVGARMFHRWDGLPLPEKCAWSASLAFALVTLARLAAITRGMWLSAVEVRLPEHEENTRPNSPRTHYLVAEFVLRWPGGFGLGLFAIRWYHDSAGKHMDAPRRPSRHHWTAQQVLTRSQRYGRWPGGLALRGRALEVVRTERDAGLASRQLALRALARFAGVVATVVGTLIGIARLPTVGQRLIFSAMSLLTTSWLLVRSRRDLNRMSQLRLRPRIPEELALEPFVLYLRPHPSDPHPQSPWRGPLDMDVHTVFVATALFRVGYIPQESPPPPNLAHLPIPADNWQSTLTTALPLAGFVVIPATGTAPETLWQLTEAVRLVPPSRLLLLLLPGEEAAQDYARFRQAAAEAFAERAETMPEGGRVGFRLPDLSPVPAPAPTSHRDPALLGVIHFADDWTPTVLRFSPVDRTSGEPSRVAQLISIRKELESLLTRIPRRIEPRDHDNEGASST